ncbi:LacI family DNA-binding transcriptional regulator [Danxiaibacter flavus]|uniref:LacI family DNA-binding transcriptional regulator n=1 Tax=Danxiaibacter flavus TaxID=3049108 RepID=A0ABV3ZHB4_9BACT|nr:LacI family DNA-binding transcriptional regulator [Chitinophagaceae bacterium DXS]
MNKDITIYDIAKELNISAATVSRALKDHSGINGNTRKRVVEKARQMGYRSNFFASNLRKRKTNTIGVIIPRLNSHFVSTAIAAMEKVASAAGYNIIISQSNESGSKEIINAQTMFDNRVDGLLVSLAYDTDTVNHFSKFAEKNIPVIFFDRVPESTEQVSIVIDNYRNGYDITKHLIEQGCKRIAHVTANLKRNVYNERFSGYKHALMDAGINFSDDLVFSCDLSEQASTEVAAKILSMKKLPDGLFAANDMSAACCIRVFKQNGLKIPKDIAIAGFNNDPVSRLIEPNITTVNYPAFQMGEMAATYMINHLAGLTNILITNKIILKSEVLIRESSLRKKS